MNTIKLNKIVFVLLCCLAFFSTLGECSSYRLEEKCGPCKITPGCPNNLCGFVNGGPVKNMESRCIDQQTCNMLDMINITIANTECKKGCSTCCMIVSIMNVVQSNDCVPDEIVS